MSLLNKIWNGIQRELFPALEEVVGHLTDKEKHFVEVPALTEGKRSKKKGAY